MAKSLNAPPLSVPRYMRNHISKGGEKRGFFPSVPFMYIWVLQKQLVRPVFVY